jgi:serine/threonine protein kinase
MLTGTLPFTASDPIEWVHCLIARYPVPPYERVKSVPTGVSSAVMKLLTKAPEERYQTASGVESDLRDCLAEWELNECICRRTRRSRSSASLRLLPLVEIDRKL